MLFIILIQEQNKTCAYPNKWRYELIIVKISYLLVLIDTKLWNNRPNEVHKVITPYSSLGRTQINTTFDRVSRLIICILSTLCDLANVVGLVFVLAI